MKSHKHGFTLIELLIVVAIIAILAAIAIPNFLAAQVRAKVSRVKADLRTVATAVESYYIDYNSYPESVPVPIVVSGTRDSAYSYLPNTITTPISYISNNRDGQPVRRGLAAGVPRERADRARGAGPGTTGDAAGFAWPRAPA